VFRYLISLNLIFAAMAIAQETDSNSNFSPEQFGITPKSKLFKLLEDKKNSDAEIDLQNEFEIKGVIEHLKYDEGETIEVSNFFASKRQELEEPMKKSSEALAESIKKSINADRSIPNCSISDSEVSSSENLLKDGTRMLLSDVLYLRKHQIPENSEEIFGSTVVIRAYEPDPKNVTYHALYGMGIKCLPARIRISTEKTEIHYGRNALKNYRKNLLGKGYMDRRAKNINF
jgi:hypothetical protein